MVGPQGFTSPKVTALLLLREKLLAHGSLWQVPPLIFVGEQETSGSLLEKTNKLWCDFTYGLSLAKKNELIK